MKTLARIKTTPTHSKRALVAGVVLAVTGYRFSKTHRRNESMAYKIIGSTAIANIVAWHLTGK